MIEVKKNHKKASAQMAGKVFENDWEQFNEIKTSNNWTAAKLLELLIAQYNDTQNHEKLLAEINQGCPEYSSELKAKIEKAQKSLKDLFSTSVDAIREQQISLSDYSTEIEGKDEQIQKLIDERNELHVLLKQKESEFGVLKRTNEASSALVDELKFKISNLASEQDYQELLREKQDIAEKVRNLENRIREMEIEKREAIVAVREEFARKAQAKNLILSDHF